MISRRPTPQRRRAADSGCQARPDEMLSVEGEVIDIKPSRSRPDRGIIALRSTQNGEAAQSLTAKLVVPRRQDGFLKRGQPG